MILGMPISTFTTLHTGLSLLGIASGIIVLLAMLFGKKLGLLTALFLAATILTSVTGFLFPSAGFTPARAVGVLSLAVLAAAVVGLYVFNLRGPWRWIYVLGAVAGLYLNSFVGVVQAFQKQPFLQPLAPTQSEPPFIAAQAIMLAIFAVLGLVALFKFHPEQSRGNHET